MIEKRLFDAWGNIAQVQDGAGNTITGLTVLDRGYTGHEHLQSVGLINMNGRVYDPKLHRFLQPDNFVQDPYNTQSYNRYGYCWNNPLKYTDPSGEWFWMAFAVGAIVGAVSGGAGYAAQAIQTGNWSWGQFGISVLGGAIIGGVSGGYASMSCTVTSNALINAFASGLIAGMMPVYGVQVGDWSFSVSPAIAFGTGGAPIGIAGGVGYSDGRKWSFSVNTTARVSAYTLGGGFSYSDGTNTYSAGFTNFGGKDPQNNWMVGYSSGDFSFKMTNDAFVGGDKARTAAAEIGIGSYSYGFNLYTTSPPDSEYHSKEPNRKGGNEDYISPIWSSSATSKKNQGKPFYTYTSGKRIFAGMYIGVRRGNHIQRLGYDGPEVQDLFQNGIHKNVVKGPYFNTNLGSLPSVFQQNFTYNPLTLYSN
ncbi:hypothetical protein D0809_00055 [Flavobacterium circumlabens]|uniref:RHS repeat-associated protein n=1 Tax=Flavobacterium circumlabens TaxID=2133765 RepID=A0A4Y7UGD3_9FLAO|nr:polymorphic toxin type 23 domain-containing protein [Flavobacterium circumlabens]TCN52474.1 RHS repeat-associated protein [Flavobacterium circumlabens]TEB45444.1 hypothetical protein D0809_00055 [Flavobacterium circumlabens]